MKKLRLEHINVDVLHHTTYTFYGLKGAIAERWAHGPIVESGAVSDADATTRPEDDTRRAASTTSGPSSRSDVPSRPGSRTGRAIEMASGRTTVRIRWRPTRQRLLPRTRAPGGGSRATSTACGEGVRGRPEGHPLRDRAGRGRDAGVGCRGRPAGGAVRPPLRGEGVRRVRGHLGRGRGARRSAPSTRLRAPRGSPDEVPRGLERARLWRQAGTSATRARSGYEGTEPVARRERCGERDRRDTGPLGFARGRCSWRGCRLAARPPGVSLGALRCQARGPRAARGGRRPASPRPPWRLPGGSSLRGWARGPPPPSALPAAADAFLGLA